MKKIYILFFVLGAHALFGQTDCDYSTINTPLGSTVTTWDWQQEEKYTLYITSGCGKKEPFSPFVANNNENLNISHLYAPEDGVIDYDPEDGWELLYKNFGEPDDPVSVPVFMLYNRFESNIRIFVYLLPQATYNQARIDISFDSGIESALLGYVKHPEKAMDSFRKQLKMSVPNLFTNGAVGSNCDNGFWLLADIPVAYDPCTCSRSSSLLIEPFLIDFDEISLVIEGGGTIKPIVSSIVSNGVSGNPIHGTVLSDLNGAFAKGAKTAKSFKKFGDGVAALSEYYTFIRSGSLTYVPGQDSLSQDSLSQDSLGQDLLGKDLPDNFPDWLKALPKIGTAFGILEFIIGGGKAKSKPKPTSFEADLSFKASGGIEGQDPYDVKVLCVPGSIKNSECTNARLPIYDNTLGIFSLLETPVVKRKPFDGQPVFDEGLGETVIPTGERFLLDKNLKYVVNPASGLVVERITARYVFKPNWPASHVWNSDLGQGVPVDKLVNNSSSDETYFTPYVPLCYLQNYVFDLFETLAPDVPFLDNQYELFLELNVVLKQNSDLVINPLYNPDADKVFVRHRYEVEVGTWPFDITDSYGLQNIPGSRVISNLELDSDLTIQAWSTIEIAGNILTNGHHLTVIAGDEIVGNVSDLPDGVDLIIGDPSAGCGYVAEQSVAQVDTFCTDINKYNPVAGQPANPTNNPETNTPESNSYLKVSPNPFQDYFKVTYSLEEDKDVIGFLRNVLGEVVKEVRLEGGVIDKELVVDCADLGTGIYFLTIQTESDLKTVRLFKQAQ